MMSPINLFSTYGLIPHGYCLSWSSGLLWLHILSDALIVFSYYSIPFTLAYFLRKRRDFPYPWLIILFGLFIVACGTTHLFSIITIWQPLYWLDGIVKAITAFISVITAILMLLVLPRVLQLPSPSQLGREIQERKIAERQLLQYQAIIESSDDAIVSVNMEGIITSWNGGAERMYGYTRNEIIGQPLDILIPDQYINDETKLLERIQQGEFIEHYESVRQCKNGKLIDISVTISPILDQENNIIGASKVARDITDRKKAEKLFRERNELYTDRIEAQVIERTRQLIDSEARSRAILKTMMDGVVHIDQHGTILSTNDSTNKLFGYEENELTGQNVNILMRGPFRSEHDEYLRSSHDKHTNVIIGRRVEVSGLHKNGSSLTLDLSVNELRVDNERSYIGVLRDISETKRIYQELWKSNEKNLALLRNASDGIHIIDTNGNLIEASDSFCSMLGYQREEAIGMHVSKWEAQLTGSELQLALGKRFETGERSEFETRHRRKDGTIIDVEISGCRLELDGEPVLFNSSRDVSNRKRLYSELIQARSAADSANKAKSDFLANMSHEIRTPISAITGFAFLAQRIDIPQRALSYFQKINSAATTLLGIVNDILDFSKIEAGKMDLEVIKFNLDEVIENVAGLFSNKAREKGVELSFGSSSDVPAWLLGDPLRLTQILTNLINNAIKFTDQGEITLLVGIVNNESNQITLRFVVKDTGIGMSLEQQTSLFKPFSQADSSTTRKYGGTGLGLVISKQLVNLMGGNIYAESEVGKGTSFIFTAQFGIPISVVNDVKLSSSFIAGKKILVVDDSAVMRKLLVALLHKLGCQTEEAESGSALLMLMQTQANADCIVMDWRMPGMDGIEAARQIREQAIAVPIVIVTGDEPELARAQAGDLVQQIMAKPVSPSKLLNCLVTLFGGQTQIQENQSGQISIPDLTGRHILLVDDNEFNREVGTELVNLTKATISTSHDGQHAVNCVLVGDKNVHFDLILMDLQMPVMDGYEAAKLIMARYPMMPIIALTADVMTNERHRLIDAGIRDVLTKPIQIDQLFQLLSHYLEAKSNIPTVISPAVQEEGEKSDQDELPELPGFDIKAALERVGDDISLYRQFLCMFRDRNINIMKEFRLSLKQGDMVAAKRFIHTLKGSAGTIGATHLSATAEQMELELEKAANPDSVLDTELMKKLDMEWEAVMASLAKLNS